MNKIILLSLVLLTGLAGCSNGPEITLPQVSPVGVANAEKIIKAAELQPVKTTDSSDDTKKIYQFDGLNTQLEFSENFILIAWQQHDKASLDKAVRLGMATLGDEAGYFIHKVDLQGEHTDYSIQGHMISNNTCISNLCTIKIHIK
ncbi:hypothetical protein ABTU74_20015 [Acinetobacter baumannii]